MEALSGLLAKVTDTLNRFANILHTHSESVTSASKSTASHAEGEKNTNPAKDAETSNLVDFIGIDVVEDYHQKKLLYNKYYHKMLKRKKSPNITNCEVLTKKGPIILKIFREDGYEEVIINLKVSDLHLAVMRVIKACPNKKNKRKGLKTITSLVKTRMDCLTQTEKELNIDFNKPLKDQDPLKELNELANKKRKRTNDFSDASESTKKFKSLVQQ
ncbi:hypothetical protein Tco_0295228 [Tanacetum coccineum]